MQNTLERAYRIADGIMKDRAKSFYQAFSQLPADQFKGVTAIYAYCRTADDIVDDRTPEMTDEELKGQIKALETALRGIYEGQSSNLYPWWPAFEDAVKRYAIPLEPFLHQLHGQKMDAEFHDIQDEDEFLEYCAAVAGSVGEMMLPLLADRANETDDPAWREACRHLGIGMQITNILRDIGEDLRMRDRVYLPKTSLDAFGVKRETLQALATGELTTIPDNVIRLWEHWATRADDYYAEIEPWMNHFHMTSRVPLLAAAYSYQKIADAVRDNNYDCFTTRCYTSKRTRLQQIQRAKRTLEHKKSQQ